MAKANRVHSTPRRISPPNPTPDVVTDLARRLLSNWDADSLTKGDEPDRRAQLNEAQAALVSLISFTEAQSPTGALVQLAMALDAADDIEGRHRETGDENNLDALRIKRLVMSAMRAIRSTLPELDPDIGALLAIYGASGRRSWHLDAEKWAAEGRAEREREEAAL
jgi:hypothetical protein